MYWHHMQPLAPVSLPKCPLAFKRCLKAFCLIRKAGLWDLEHMPLSVVFEQLLVPRGPCLAEAAGAAGRAQAVPLCLTRGAPATALSPKAPGSSCVVLDQGTQETHLKRFQAKVNVYSAMLPGGRSCRAEAHEPIRAAVLQQGRVLGALGTAGPGGAGINQATAAERAGEDR